MLPEPSQQIPNMCRLSSLGCGTPLAQAPHHVLISCSLMSHLLLAPRLLLCWVINAVCFFQTWFCFNHIVQVIVRPAALLHGSPRFLRHSHHTQWYPSLPGNLAHRCSVLSCQTREYFSEILCGFCPSDCTVTFTKLA